ncbi:MAG: hypothetical protein AB2807_06935 [Candidatus Sedimenticola endophacoides]
MRQNLLNRDERSEDGRVIVDVTTTQIEDLYNDFDKNTPFARRDLDPELGEYLIDCVRELRRAPFLIRFSLARPPDAQGWSRVCKSVAGYFLYLVEKEREKVLHLFRRSAILSGIGISILFLSVTVNQGLDSDSPVVVKVIAEGLTVAAWVSLWEAFAVFLVEWPPHRKHIRLLERIATAELRLRAQAVG